MFDGLMAFLAGFGSVLDIFGTSHPKFEQLELGDFETDAEALRSDWYKILPPTQPQELQ